jgi:protein TonB
MYEILLESGARAERSFGGSAASIVAHVAMISAAVLATSRNHVAAATPEPVTMVTIRYPSQPAPEPRPLRTAAASPTRFADLGAVLPTLTLPTIVPVGIPEVTFNPSATPVATEYGRGPVRPASGIVGSGDGERGAAEPWTVAELTMRMLGKPIPPRYPEPLRQAGIEGEVLVKFVVDTTGRVAMSSVEVLRSPHDLFTKAVRETLTALRFQPAAIGDRRVPVTAMMPFVFTLHR